MKNKFWIIMAVLMFFTTQANALPITALLVDNPNIRVGDQFSVEVRVDNDVMGEELLAFGFDLQGVDPLLNYVGANIGPAFLDTSFGVNNVAGLAFPGVTDTDILFATLVFDALDVGVAQIAVEGIFDGFFSGMFYEFSGFDIAAQTSVVISQRPPAVPEPAGLFIAGLILFMCIRKRPFN
ncbi:MAG: hypothetical protein Alis3KO_23400 [Aliiglaciecola sp.]